MRLSVHKLYAPPATAGAKPAEAIGFALIEDDLELAIDNGAVGPIPIDEFELTLNCACGAYVHDSHTDPNGKTIPRIACRVHRYVKGDGEEGIRLWRPYLTDPNQIALVRAHPSVPVFSREEWRTDLKGCVWYALAPLDGWAQEIKRNGRKGKRARRAG